MMQATGHIRSQATDEFLNEARKWELRGNLIENRTGVHDPRNVVTLEFSIQQLARLADILRHAGGINYFDLNNGYVASEVDWATFRARVEWEEKQAARHQH